LDRFGPNQPRFLADRRATRWERGKKIVFRGGKNNYIYRKYRGALTKKTPVPRLQFYYFGLKTENDVPETQILLSLGYHGNRT
jgi:hypothetical protein